MRARVRRGVFMFRLGDAPPKSAVSARRGIPSGSGGVRLGQPFDEFCSKHGMRDIERLRRKDQRYKASTLFRGGGHIFVTEPRRGFDCQQLDFNVRLAALPSGQRPQDQHFASPSALRVVIGRLPRAGFGRKFSVPGAWRSKGFRRWRQFAASIRFQTKGLARMRRSVPTSAGTGRVRSASRHTPPAKTHPRQG